MSRTRHNDEPTTEDLLNLRPVARRIAKRVRAVEPPFVLGIHGEWGTGKSSLLGMVNDEVTKLSGGSARIVTFHAWRHQHEAQPAVALLHTIRDHFYSDQTVWEELKKGLKVGLLGAFRTFDELAFGLLSGQSGGKGLTNAVREESARHDAAVFAPLLPSEALPQAFEAAIGTLLGGNGGENEERLVVLVDDLDRCSDAAVVRLLEGMRLYFAIKRTVFVIAADRDALVEAVYRELYKGDVTKDDEGQRRLRGRASAYIEKFFQAVDTVPSWPDRAPLLGKLWLGPDTERTALTELVAKHGFLPPNPRKVKRYLSELGCRLDAMGDAPCVGDRLALACAVQYVQTFHPEVYRLIERSPGDLTRLIAHVRAPRPEAVSGTPTRHLRFLSEGTSSLDEASATLDMLHPDLFHAASLFQALGAVTDDAYARVMLHNVLLHKGELA